MSKDIKALLVPVGKKPQEITIANELESLQSAVKGFIEFFPLSRGVNLIVNEEGKSTAWKATE